MNRLAIVALFSVAMLGCTREGAPSLVAILTSDLSIPSETNTLVVRVLSGNTVLKEQAWTLGEAPRDGWPQTLPIFSGEAHPKDINLAAELRVNAPGQPSVVVGFYEGPASFPSSGRLDITIDIPRSCVDEDMDGYGVGFGCDRPDCDDTRPDIPEVSFCPGLELPDAGPKPDLGQVDMGPIDMGPFDTGPTGPDAGEPLCGPRMQVCTPDEVCFMDMGCFTECVDNRDCGALHLGCLDTFGVCICRVPCIDSTDCGPFECTDNCCQI